MNLTGKQVAVLVENNYQELEVWYPIFRFQEAGAKVTIVGPAAERYLSKLGYPVVANVGAEQAQAAGYDAVIIPGGYAPDLMRLNPAMVALVRNLAAAGKIIAAICHGGWMLVSADIIKGKRVTGAPSIKDDLRNAGAIYEDREVIRDGNIITSRKPADIPAFSAAIVQALSERGSELAA